MEDNTNATIIGNPSGTQTIMIVTAKVTVSITKSTTYFGLVIKLIIIASSKLLLINTELKILEIDAKMAPI